ncbi:MAG: glycerophosphodiester phosphodiesterase [Betaproteobacteria bacterium]
MKNWPYPTLIAHRGGGKLAPENTLAALAMGHKHSYIAVEFDAKLSQDNVAVLMHDATLDRTTNGSGLVCEKDISALESLDAGGWYSETFRGERIPRLTNVSRYLHSIGMMANVEIKACPGREAETGRVVAELCDELWRDRLVKPLISSFSMEALRAARIAAPTLPMGLLVDAPAEKYLAFMDELGAVSLHCQHEGITVELVRFFHRHHYRVMTYTVNEPSRVRTLLEMDVDGIFTDNLEVMAQLFPEQLTDAGKRICNPDDAGFEWPLDVPPIG